MTDQIQTDDTQTDPTVPHGQPTADEVASAYGVPAGSVPADTEPSGSDTHDAHDTHAAQAAGAEDVEDPLADAERRAAEAGQTAGSLLLALEATAAERDEYLDTAQRSRAEFDNFRRRTVKEAASARQAGVGDLATRLLDVLDDLDRTATVAEASDDAGLAGGVQAVHRKLVDALVASGIERVAEVGVPFDPARHEAVQQVPADEPVAEPQVDQVLRPGYLLGERVLRAAMVVVRQ